jgi:lysophospholipase L1-like esterase
MPPRWSVLAAKRAASRVLCISALLASAGCVHGQRAMDAERWIATWGTAQQLAVETRPPWVQPPPRAENAPPPPPSPIPPYPTSFSDETVRMVVRASAGGERVRITLSNAAGREPVRFGAVHVALHEGGSRVAASSDRAVTFGGSAAITLEPGALAVSDPVDLAVGPLAELAISLYLPERTGAPTTHELALNTTYVARGNDVAAPVLPDAATNLTYFWLAGVEVAADAPAAGTIVAFGDSITDGFSTTPNAHRAWPALLAARLQGNAATAHWGVANAGIAGNRVRRDLVGTSALARFDRDVLARAGVRWLVLFEGINDVTWSALPGAPASQRTSAEQLVDALAQLVDRAHAHGIRVVGATLMPMGGLWLHNPETEGLRQAVNRWIRTSGKFDAVVDFDAVTRDPADPARLRPDFDSGDHIHPNDAGNAAMAEAIDLSLFAR